MSKFMLFTLGLIFLTGCEGTVNLSNTTNNFGTQTATATRDDTPKDMPYRYPGSQYNDSSCWGNVLRTNGPSYKVAGNSGYFCTGGGASYSDPPYPAYPNDSIWVGFYRDGTVSVTDQSGVDKIYNASMASTINVFGMSRIDCELNLVRASIPKIIMARVNYPGIPTTVLDASDHLRYIEMQTMTDSGLDSGSIWTCEFRPTFGI